jgi:hypothetical protein
LTIPTRQELEEWADALNRGQAVTEMFPRFVEGYKHLLRVARAAAHTIRKNQYGVFTIIIDQKLAIDSLKELETALEPVREALKGQMNLDE